MNFGQFLATGETSSSLRWWIEHKAKPLPDTKRSKPIPVFTSKRIYPKPPLEEAVRWAKIFIADGKRPCNLARLVGKKIKRSEKRVRVYLEDFLSELKAK